MVWLKFRDLFFSLPNIDLVEAPVALQQPGKASGQSSMPPSKLLPMQLLTKYIYKS